MKAKHIIALLCSLLIIFLYGMYQHRINTVEYQHVKVGYIYIGDASNPYTQNFMMAQADMEETYGSDVEVVALYNVPEGHEVDDALQRLVDEKCDIIFGTSYGYGEQIKSCAATHPDIQFCQATSDNANTEPLVSNYHTFMGHVYQGRYISGVVAGMKLQELLENGDITADDLWIGYVGAFPYAEVISGYTAFYLGAASIVPEVRMKVVYTNSWSDYNIEKKYAEKLIDDGCIIISQHSDTTGPAVACEKTAFQKKVYHVGYNQNMIDVAPTTSLIGSKINWAPYMVEAVEAVRAGAKIEDHVSAVINGTDAGAGFEKDWVQMFRLNGLIAALGTREAITKIEKQFRDGELQVFQGNYTGTDPFDPSDTIDLRDGFRENATLSAPSFHYILDDVITVVEYP